MRGALRGAIRWLVWLDDSWLGDLIGAVCLAATGYLLFFFAGILQ